MMLRSRRRASASPHAASPPAARRPSPSASPQTPKRRMLYLLAIVGIGLVAMRALSARVPPTASFFVDRNDGGSPERRLAALATAAAAKNSSLRFDWTDLPPQTPLGKIIEAAQARCLNATAIAATGPVEVVPFDILHSGMGSSLHTWMYPLCHASSAGKLLATGGSWHWNDPQRCPEILKDAAGEGTDRGGAASPLWCYFGHHESGLRCPPNTIDWGSADRAPRVAKWNKYRCREYMERHGGVKGVYAAGTEWLFQNVSSLVVQEAERQIREEAFPLDGNNGSVSTTEGRFRRWPGLPPRESLVTVHFRAGDKEQEMKLVTAKELVDATISLLTEEERRGDAPVHVYLVTEDPLAEKKFAAAAPSNFVVHTSGGTVGQSGQAMLSQPSGAGLGSLGALLVAMEADRYVITGGSNWSRLIDELRKTVVDSRCNGCTRAVDLRPVTLW